MKSEIVIDVTALRALSGVRGIGRYLRDLLTGLSAIADTEAPELSFSAATHIDPRGLRLTRDLRAAAEESIAEANTGPSNLVARRRVLLGPLAGLAGAKLLHVGELMGTPFLRPVPMLVTCYDLIPLRYPKYYLGGPLTYINPTYPRLSPAYVTRFLKDARRYHSARRVVCISEQTRRDLLDDILHLPADRVDAVQTGIELARYSDADTAPTPRERPFALYVGHADWRKNIETMFDAIRIANESAPLDLTGGLRPKDLAKMKAMAEERGVAAYVKFLGFVADADLGPLYREAVALLFLSRLEGFGLPVVEAMASGCPAIVARNSAADEVAGDAGYVVSPDDPREAAGKLLHLLRHPEDREALSRAGIVRAPRYNAIDMARGYLASYRKALGLPTA